MSFVHLDDQFARKKVKRVGIFSIQQPLITPDRKIITTASREESGVDR
jgi:hypothetical protein